MMVKTTIEASQKEKKNPIEIIIAFMHLPNEYPCKVLKYNLKLINEIHKVKFNIQ